MLIVIRSLANSMALLHKSQLLISFDSDFLFMLDINVSDKDNKCQIIEKYELAWWNERKPPDLDAAEFWMDHHLTDAWISTKGSFLPPKMVMSVSSPPFQICRQCHPYQLRLKTSAMYSVLKVLIIPMTIPVTNVLSIAKSFPIHSRTLLTYISIQMRC